LYLERTLFPF